MAKVELKEVTPPPTAKRHVVTVTLDERDLHLVRVNVKKEWGTNPDSTGSYMLDCVIRDIIAAAYQVEL